NEKGDGKMTEALKLVKGGKKEGRVIEVALSSLSLHSKQDEFSPPMSDRQWKKFVKGINEVGVLQPLTVTEGFRIIDGKHRFLALKELGKEHVRVFVDEEIDEGDIPNYIVNNKLEKAELKPGQRAAIVILLYYHDLKAEGKKTQGNRTDLTSAPNGAKVRNSKVLADKSGVGHGSITRLITVYRNRLDLFYRVRDGEIAIGRAYQQMKDDEKPEEVAEEVTPADTLKRDIERMIEDDSTQPQYDESEHELSPRNRAVRLRKDTLSMSAKVLNEVDSIKSTKDDVKDSARSQLLSLATSCIITLGQTAEKQNEQDLLYMALEVIKKIEEEIFND